MYKSQFRETVIEKSNKINPKDFGFDHKAKKLDKSKVYVEIINGGDGIWELTGSDSMTIYASGRSERELKQWASKQRNPQFLIVERDYSGMAPGEM